MCQTGAARPIDFRDLGDASHRRPAPLARRREIPERCSGAQRWFRVAGSGRSSKAWFHGLVPRQRRRCSPGFASWMWSCRASFRQAIVIAEVRTGRVVARGCRRRRSVAVVRVPSQRRSFLRIVRDEASPGVRSSHRSRPGGAERSWNDVRRCRAALAAVPSSPWPPRVADQYTAAAGEFVVSLEGSRFAPPPRKCRSATTGPVRCSAAKDLVPVPCCLEGVVPAEV
jgi:hypothetical protein